MYNCRQGHSTRFVKEHGMLGSATEDDAEFFKFSGCLNFGAKLNLSKKGIGAQFVSIQNKLSKFYSGTFVLIVLRVTNSQTFYL